MRVALALFGGRGGGGGGGGGEDETSYVERMMS